MLTSIKRNSLVLGIFACVCTGIVAITESLTSDKIKQQEQKQLLSILDQVVPTDLYDNKLYQSCVMLKDKALGTTEPMPAYIAKKAGTPTAIAIESIAPDGYSGPIKIIVGINEHGIILGTRVLEHQETPGLGDKIDKRVSDWVDRFSQKQVTKANYGMWKVRKDGGDFDQFTGATITPRAVVKAVRNTVQYFDQNKERIFANSVACGES